MHQSQIDACHVNGRDFNFLGALRQAIISQASKSLYSSSLIACKHNEPILVTKNYRVTTNLLQKYRIAPLPHFICTSYLRLQLYTCNRTHF